MYNFLSIFFIKTNINFFVDVFVNLNIRFVFFFGSKKRDYDVKVNVDIA